MAASNAAWLIRQDSRITSESTGSLKLPFAFWEALWPNI
jgi:hypothetical protein